MRMRSIIPLIFFHWGAISLAEDGQNRQEFRLDNNKIMMVVQGSERSPSAVAGAMTLHGHTANALGPGFKLMESYFDYASNGGVLTNLHDYGDGTLAVGRMGAASPTLNDRGTFFSFFNGATWSPMVKVEQARRGWSSIAALRDGRSVIVSQSGNEVNVDSAKGLGNWNSYITEGATSAAVQWPRFTVDGADNIIICSTTNATVNGVTFIKQVNISRDQGQTWQHAFLWPDTTGRKPSFSADDQAVAAWGDNLAVAVCEIGGDTHLWTSADNGMSWTYQNITHYPPAIPAGTESLRGAGTIDALYDPAGNLHLFWENYLARAAAAGTGMELYESTDDPILHWSAAHGIVPVVRFSDLPGAAHDSLVFAAGGSFDQVNADGALLKQPQAGADAAGNLYLLFAAFRPNDVDVEGAHFTDLYAVGSHDGGKSWSAPVNVTDTPQSEDLWASLADHVGDSLRFVYQSDGNTGNGFIGGGVAPAAFLYLAYAKSNLGLAPNTVAVHSMPVPAVWVLQQNYPNPFNPVTSVQYAVAREGWVSLKVYDVLGREVATLVNQKLATGNHTAAWHAQDAPSGIYFCRLEAENFSQMRKMILMR